MHPVEAIQEGLSYDAKPATLLQGVLGSKKSESGWASESLPQLWDEYFCTMIQDGIQALQDALTCTPEVHWLFENSGQAHMCPQWFLSEQLKT